MRANLGTSLLLLVFAAISVAAQEADNRQEPAQSARATEVDDLEPAVSSQELATEIGDFAEASASPESAASQAAETLLAQEVRRRPAQNGVMDEIDLGRTEITGNQELPKVLYIVPWQKSDPGDLTGKPINTLLDEVLAPIDRAEFMRQVEYYDDLYPRADP